MKCSLFFNFDLLPGDDERDLLRHVERQAVLADELGFARIWLAEHHFQEYGRMPSPLTFLARLSGLTHSIRLGTAVVEAPYYNPVRLAEDVALLDVLSAGRVDLGLGSGAGNKVTEFGHLGIRKEEKGPRLREIVEILWRLLGDAPATFTGDHYAVKDLTISPSPLQPREQLLWLAASNGTVDLAGRLGLPILMPRATSDERLRDLTSAYRRFLPAEANGYISALRFTFVAPTREEAHRRTYRAFRRYAKYDAGIDWNGRTDSQEYADICARIRFVAGTPDDVARQMEAWRRDHVLDEVMCQMYAAGIDAEDAIESMELMATQVWPKIGVEATKGNPVRG